MSSKLEVAVAVGRARHAVTELTQSDEPRLVYVCAAWRTGPYARARYNVWVPSDRIGYVLDEFWMPRDGGVMSVQRYTFETLDELHEFVDTKDVYLWGTRSAGQMNKTECGWPTSDWVYYRGGVGPVMPHVGCDELPFLVETIF